VGTTTVALNVACALAKKGTVVAAELRSTPGTFALQLHQTPVETIAGLLALAPGEIGRKQIEAHLTSAPSGLKVLHGAQDYFERWEIEPAHVEAIVGGLSRMAEYAVLDLPEYSSPALEPALHMCDLVTLVVEPEPVSVNAGRELLQALKPKGLSTAIICAVVVNRAVLSAPLTSADIRSQLGCDVIGTVPPVADGCALAVKLGAPLVLSQPESMATAALNDIADRLAVDNVVALHA
jgi:Flp pilus assembly CpaE family ATPase